MSETSSARFRTVILISLDIATVFASELDLGTLLAPTLQEYARDAISESLASTEDSIEDFDALTSRFRSRVIRYSTPGTLRAIDSWQRTAFCNHSEFSRRWLWSVLLRQLQSAWDDGCPPDVPLRSRQFTCERLRVRGYLSYQANVRAEVDIVHHSFNSRWDKMIGKVYRDFFTITTSLAEIALTLAAGRLWSAFRREVPESEIDRLQDWGHMTARRENMPLVYVRLPKGEPAGRKGGRKGGEKGTEPFST